MAFLQFKRIRGILCLFLLVLSFGVAAAAGDYTLSRAKSYLVRQIIEVSNGGNGIASNLKITFPTFVTEGLPPYQNLISFRANSTNYQVVKSGLEKVLTYQRPSLGADQSFRLELEYRFLNAAIDYRLRPIEARYDPANRYLQAEAGVESNAGNIITLAQSITAQAKTPLDKAKAIFDYVNANLTYNTEPGKGPHDALETLRRGMGSCEDFSLLYIALCRAAGIPSRLVSGYRFNQNQVTERENDPEPLGHAWTEVYLPEAGWVPVDPTYQYTLNGVRTVSYDFFGKIRPDDRHLFFSYARMGSHEVRWEYNPKQPAKINVKCLTRIRAL